MAIETNVAVKKYLFNIDQYHLIGEAGILAPSHRVELINGEIIEKNTIKSLHAGTVKLLNRLLSEIWDNDVIISVQDPVELNQYAEPEPDLAILKYRDDLYTKSHPKPSASGIKSLLLKSKLFWGLMMPKNADIAKATARLFGEIRPQKNEAWGGKDLVSEALVMYCWSLK